MFWNPESIRWILQAPDGAVERVCLQRVSLMVTRIRSADAQSRSLDVELLEPLVAVPSERMPLSRIFRWRNWNGKPMSKIAQRMPRIKPSPILSVVAKSAAMRESVWGPDADRHAKPLIHLAVEGAALNAYSQRTATLRYVS
jgi:hypothetical protein